MTNYIEKLYKLADVNNFKFTISEKWIGQTLKYDFKLIDHFNFTPEKQIKLIKWFADWGDFDRTLDITHNTGDFYTIYFDYSRCTAKGLEQALAGLIVTFWNELNKQQQEEIRNILND